MSDPTQTPSGSLESPSATLLVRILDSVVTELEQHPSLAARLRKVLGVTEQASLQAQAQAKFMSVREYAMHARVSERTMRYLLRDEMVEGIHYHRDGRTGRRVIVHVNEVDEWRASRRRTSDMNQSLEELASNEVLRRRAQLALRKIRGH